MTDRGRGELAFAGLAVEGFDMAGKTGTAQVRRGLTMRCADGAPISRFRGSFAIMICSLPLRLW